LFDIILDKIKSFFSSRLVPLMAIFLTLFAILLHRVFTIQIVNNANQSATEEYYNEVTRDIKSTRGIIYDRTGKILATNELTYAVVLSDSAQLGTNAEKNSMILKLVQILKKNGYEIEVDFPIKIDENGEFSFTVEGNAELRFKKNAYCLKSVNDLTEEQKNATAEDVFNFLRYGDEGISTMFNISEDYTLEETFEIMKVRYTMLITYPKYTQFTIASNINEKTVAAVKENMADLPGVEVKQQSTRVYNNSKYFAHILGYTGVINATEEEALNAQYGENTYSSTDVVGKTGLEKEMEAYLAGTKGEESVTITDSGKVVDVTVKTEPVVGNDVYLTIDADLQMACYNILERNIAATLISKINNGYDYGGKGVKAADIKIPIYEVYNALINNNVIEIDQFREEDASELEQQVYGYFLSKRESIFNSLMTMMKVDSTITNAQAGSEMAEYLDYVYSKLVSSEVGILVSSKINKTDETYLAYRNDEISLSQFLQYAITQNWVDLSKLGIGNEYFSTDEIYSKLFSYAMELLVDDNSFEKKIYRTLIFSRILSGKEICLLLFDQGVLEYNENDVKKLQNGAISAYTFMIQKLTNLEITPGQLALEPCSGSIVVTDVNTGDVLAMVSYPSYDNNKLANKIDWNYYSKLLEDNATPLNNRPTSQLTTTGSTFKPLTTLIGLGEGIITPYTRITDRYVFDAITPSPKCWKVGGHGTLDAAHSIMHSCNYFFYEVGYKLSLDETGKYNDALGISTIQKYATMFGLGDKSGVEVSEETPTISSTDAVRTAIGYYHKFAPVQISRYISAVANSGTVYNLTLLDRVTDKNQNVILQNEASVFNQIDQFTKTEWDVVHEGMYLVVNTSANSLNTLFGDLGVRVAGKTGTAQVSLNNPHHALFVSYAPYEAPEISVSVVIPNGYASANAAKVGREVMGFYFNDENKDELLSGDYTAGTATNIQISD